MGYRYQVHATANPIPTQKVDILQFDSTWLDYARFLPGFVTIFILNRVLLYLLITKTWLECIEFKYYSNL